MVCALFFLMFKPYFMVSLRIHDKISNFIFYVVKFYTRNAHARNNCIYVCDVSVEMGMRKDNEIYHFLYCI